MVAKIYSSGLMGVNGYTVEVEVDTSQGLPSFETVGLPDSAVKESKERVRTAIKNSGYTFPVKKITVNLAPANTRKEGPAYDLPIALGILSTIGIIKCKDISDSIFIGELSLDGRVKAVDGVLPMVLSARDNGFKRCFVPCENADEAALVNDISVYPVSSVSQLVDFFNGKIKIEPRIVDIEAFFNNKEQETNDFADVKGQENVPKDIPVLYVANHNSYFDIMITYALCPDLTGYIAKDSLEKVPLLNIWMKRLYCLFLKRDDMKASLKTILQAIEYVKKGISICIFPEGTRGDSDEMAPFKEGSMKIAEKTGCPIVPMAISHTRDIIKDHMPFVKPTHVTVEYGAPIYPKELAKEERRALGRLSQNMIQEMLDAQKASEQ